jgi:hypothetical protein
MLLTAAYGQEGATVWYLEIKTTACWALTAAR